MDIFAKELMSISVISIDPETELVDAIQAMLNHLYSCMIVIQDDLPVGIITERDIVRLMAEYYTNRPEHPILVKNVMSHPVTTITEQTTLFEALVISTSQMIRHLPVVDNEGRFLGLVTQSDLAKAHFQVFAKQNEEIENSINCRTKELQDANEKLKKLSMLDALMGIGNRRAMEVDLEHTHALALRYQRTYAAVLFDVDFFKLFNDTVGHQSGDDVLRKISSYLQTCIRKSDRLYRYGGEEILMLLPETEPLGAMILAGRIIEGMSHLEISHPVSPFSVVTMSCGVACQTLDKAHESWQEVVAMADLALYDAKHSGRNRAHAAPVQ